MKYRRMMINEIQFDLLRRIFELPENSVAQLCGRLNLNGPEMRYLRELRDRFQSSREYGDKAWFDL